MARYRHNKQNRCSTRHLKERAESEVANGEGKEGYWHRQYARRTGQWADGTEAIEMKRTKSTARRCKYCNKTGHNTRTCPELAEAKATYMRELVAWSLLTTTEIPCFTWLSLWLGTLLTTNVFVTTVETLSSFDD